MALSEHLTTAIARFRIDAPQGVRPEGGPSPEAVQTLAELTRQLGRLATQLEASGGRPGVREVSRAGATGPAQQAPRASKSAPAEDLKALVGSVNEIVGRLSRRLE